MLDDLQSSTLSSKQGIERKGHPETLASKDEALYPHCGCKSHGRESKAFPIEGKRQDCWHARRGTVPADRDAFWKNGFVKKATVRILLLSYM